MMILIKRVCNVDGVLVETGEKIRFDADNVEFNGNCLRLFKNGKLDVEFSMDYMRYTLEIRKI